MFTNYFKTAWRSVVKNKAFSGINIAGLGLGMACSLLIFLWVQDEQHMDKFHTHGKNLCLVYERVFSAGKIDAGPWTPGMLAQELKRRVPEIRFASGFRRDAEGLFEMGRVPAGVQPNSFRPQILRRIGHGRFYRLEADRQDGDRNGDGGREDKDPRPDLDAVIVFEQPVLQEIQGHRRRQYTTQEDEHDKIL
jgi:hypothetical protein